MGVRRHEGGGARTGHHVHLGGGMGGGEFNTITMVLYSNGNTLFTTTKHTTLNRERNITHIIKKIEINHIN